MFHYVCFLQGLCDSIIKILLYERTQRFVNKFESHLFKVSLTHQPTPFILPPPSPPPLINIQSPYNQAQESHRNNKQQASCQIQQQQKFKKSQKKQQTLQVTSIDKNIEKKERKIDFVNIYLLFQCMRFLEAFEFTNFIFFIFYLFNVDIKTEYIFRIYQKKQLITIIIPN